MRTEEEMLELILNTAREDDRILAVYLEGSRVNPRAPKDLFQDYDVVYMVRETRSFQEEEKGWIDCFGERLFMQYPEEGRTEEERSRCYGWLMLFSDGNRVDLHVCTEEYVREQLSHSSMYRILLDKTKSLPILKEETDRDYWTARPSQKEFSAACNEFWWCLNNVAKGLWREELPYVMEMLDQIIRPELRRLLEWRIGLERDFRVSPGKSGKYLGKYLPEEVYQAYLDTYPRARTEEIWEAVFGMCRLFQREALDLGRKLGFFYDEREGENSKAYLEQVRSLSRDAREIFPKKDKKA